jgi:NADPH:quinone reductase-like Zn-dependent oxidoreductase
MSANPIAVFEACGQPQDVLAVKMAEKRAPKPGEVLVQMQAAPINPADINFVQGVYGIKPTFPESPAGLEGFGIVEESNDSSLQVGDRVIMLRGVGTWSHYLTAPADQFLKVEADVDPFQAAMLKVNPLTALRMLQGYVDLKPGDWVVQNAANSGVGRCIIQIAKKLGVRTINLVRRPDELRDELTALGADIVLGEGEEGLVQKAIELTGGVRPVLASNAVGGESALRLMDMLAPGGTMATYGAMSKRSIKVPNGFLIFKGICLKGLWVTQWLKTSTREQQVAAYRQLAEWMAAGELSQAIDTIYDLQQIREATAKAQEEFRHGKILLKLNPEL